MLDDNAVRASFRFDPDQVQALRTQWGVLLDAAVWADLKAGKIGAIPRLRKRLLELGECLRSVVNDRSWIPQPREQIKSAAAACLNLRDALLNLERAAKLLDGGNDLDTFECQLLAFRADLLRFIETHEQVWYTLLETLYSKEPDAG